MAETSVGTEPDAAPLLPKGNPPRLLRGGAMLAVGAAGALVAMSASPRLAHGLALGLVGCVLASVGIVDLLGGFDDRGRPSTRVDLGALGATPALWVLAAGTTWISLRLSVAGRLPVIGGGALVTASFVALVAATFEVGARLGPLSHDEAGERRPLVRRHGFWLCVAASVIALPTLGAHSLTDPWETHYGEVAREMLSRDDWISTWWAQEGWFFSKPVLNFWLQALSMAGLGVDFHPGRMLAPVGGLTPRPEWAVRLPIFLVALVGSYLLYKGVARAFGRRAGLLGGLALWTMPQWFFLSHQTMADMPFVAAMSAAMGLFLLGIFGDAEARVRVHAVRTPLGEVRLTAFSLLAFALALAVLPQALYLASRNLTVDVAARAAWLHGDTFWAGSFGNCGLPGNEQCSLHRPTNLRLQPWVQALGWLGALAVALWVSRGERRASRLAFLGAFLFAGVSTLAKGPAGLLLPVACAGAYVVATGRLRDLTRMELVVGLLVVVVVAVPWYLAMHLRHGPQFLDRLIFHDMWKRALTHVHDTNEGDDTSVRFYLWQLGYALFPWTGLVPLGLTYWMRKPDAWSPRFVLGLPLIVAVRAALPGGSEGDAPPDPAKAEEKQKGDAAIFLVMWFLIAFALFTFMGTKFHHYIFPAVPPAAMMVGVVLDDALEGAGSAGKGRVIPY
ncbi:MAG: glycosyltransferase family 39 protein, partial [Polyangiaceae bacterium]|nr:glycosyltransferase family 39 protein [Polyangiaceae bacterium]